ncbi:uncharacterized protein [Nicotiana sylvestris]|uniref:uncharacterized protein n=1 Tax=Nicotiana sylvestris TaxID=4096 RepID=UPI00388CE0C9
MLKKDVATSWTEECQKAFDKIKEYLSKPPVLVPLELGRTLLIYLSVLDGALGYVLGQHDVTGRKEQAIYCLSKKLTPYEARYFLLERTCYALTWITQNLSLYFCAYTTYLISMMDPLKYIFQKPMSTGTLEKWQILLHEFNIIYEKISPKHMMGGECSSTELQNFKGVGIRAVLVSETGQHYPVSAKLRFPCTNNMVEYEACILGLSLAIDMNVQESMSSTKIEFKHVPKIQNEFADALATLSSMIQHPDKNFIDPILIGIRKQLAYCALVEEESDGNLWFHDIKEYLEKGEYLEHVTHKKKRTL